MHCRGLGFLGGACYLYGSLVNGFYQVAQLVDRVVDRVGDRTGEVLGYGRVYRQVTVGEVGDFVELRIDVAVIGAAFAAAFGSANAFAVGVRDTDGDRCAV